MWQLIKRKRAFLTSRWYISKETAVRFHFLVSGPFDEAWWGIVGLTSAYYYSSFPPHTSSRVLLRPRFFLWGMRRNRQSDVSTLSLAIPSTHLSPVFLKTSVRRILIGWWEMPLPAILTRHSHHALILFLDFLKRRDDRICLCLQWNRAFLRWEWQCRQIP